MLDITKIVGQIQGVSEHLQLETLASRQRLEKAIDSLNKIINNQEKLVELQQLWFERMTLFSSATPVEPINTNIKINQPPEKHSVFATDGSQIAPSHHDIAYCYLINIGRVMLHYGQNLHPLLDSIPEVYYKPEDLYASRQWGIRTEEWMNYKRTVSESIALAEMSSRWVCPPGAHFEPNLALVDGSLTYWFLEQLPLEARQQILNPVLSAWDKLRQNRIPLMGYISASRAIESVNFVRLGLCPFSSPNCTVNCGETINIESPPCYQLESLKDITLFNHLLQPGSRGCLWKSNANILNYYAEEHQTYFCYVNVGTEIGRVEIPAWVVEDSALFQQSLSILLAQVHKGYGYPLAISEAHNLAVIRSADRSRFFLLLEDEMIKKGLQNVGTSYKETRKRGSIA